MVVRTGTILIHPLLGEMTVTYIGQNYIEEIEGEFHEGKLIVARFDRLIKGVTWRTKVGDNLVSELRFHERYLNKLQVKNGD
jgi:hypothetical protein